MPGRPAGSARMRNVGADEGPGCRGRPFSPVRYARVILSSPSDGEPTPGSAVDVAMSSAARTASASVTDSTIRPRASRSACSAAEDCPWPRSRTRVGGPRCPPVNSRPTRAARLTGCRTCPNAGKSRRQLGYSTHTWSSRRRRERLDRAHRKRRPGVVKGRRQEPAASAEYKRATVTDGVFGAFGAPTNGSAFMG